MSQQRRFLGKYSLGARLAMALLALIILVGISMAGSKLRKRGNEAMAYTKLEMAAKNITDLAESLSNYFNGARTFMPMVMTPDGPTLDSVRWAKDSPAAYVQYAAPFLNDPFGEDPTTQLRYWTDGKGWTIWSKGPDGDYDLTDPAVYGAPGIEATAGIADYVFNIGNGVISNGDIIQIYRPAPEE